MRAGKQLTRRDVAVALLSILLLLNLGVATEAGRERAKRAVCLANLKQLMSAWIAYADQNDGKIVNGAGGFHYVSTGMTSDGTAVTIVERAWVGKGWGANWNNANVANTGMTEEQKKAAIREGALWPLMGDERCYKCPVGKPYEWVNYSIVDAMNGSYMARGPVVVSLGVNHPDAVGKKIGRTVLWIKSRNEIDLPGPDQRMVFIDEGAVTPDSFSVSYDRGRWWDDPPIRHNDGATVSWADGHASDLRWKAAETIKLARQHADYYGGGFTPSTEEGSRDLQDFQRARLGQARIRTLEIAEQGPDTDCDWSVPKCQPERSAAP